MRLSQVCCPPQLDNELAAEKVFNQRQDRPCRQSAFRALCVSYWCQQTHNLKTVSPTYNDYRTSNAMKKDTACAEEGLGVNNIFRRSLRGSYTPGGKVEIILPGTMEDAILESTVFHENTHRYLFQSTSYGIVQQVISLLSQHRGHLPEQLKKKVDDLRVHLWDQSSLVHEGAATYRQYCWIRTQISKEVAEKYVKEKPPLYQSGFNLFATAVEAADVNAFDNEATALLLAEAALLTDILDHLPDILEGKTEALTSSSQKDSPNTRMKQIAETLAGGSDQRRLKIPEELLAAIEDGKLPLMSREYAKAWTVLLAGVGDITNIPLYGQQDYPEFFPNRLRELQEILSIEPMRDAVIYLSIETFSSFGIFRPCPV